MLRISSNIPSLTAQKAYRRTERETSQALRELASGTRLSSPGADPAGLAISENLHAQVKGYRAAFNNTENATSFIAIADGSLAEQSNIVIRLRELAVQAASDTLSDKEREFLNTEFTQLTEELDRIARSTRFGSQPLLDGTRKTYEFQVGVNSGSENIIRHTHDTDSTASNLGLDGLEISDKRGARSALGDLDEAVFTLNSSRAQLGAIQSRLESAASHISTQVENLSAAQSKIADTDIADAVSRLRRNQVLAQYQIVALQNANDQTTNALRLIA